MVAHLDLVAARGHRLGEGDKGGLGAAERPRLRRLCRRTAMPSSAITTLAINLGSSRAFR